MEVCFIFLLKGGTEFLSIIEVTFSLQSLYVGCVQPLCSYILYNAEYCAEMTCSSVTSSDAKKLECLQGGVCGSLL